MNRTIKLLMLSDIFLLTGFGLIAPILAIFIKENLVGGTIIAAGLASTTFLVTKSIIQLPFSKYVDSHRNKVRWLIIGTSLIVLVPFIYVFAKHVNTIFIAQIVHGIGSGLAYPTWLSLWSTHLDKKHEGFEWSLYSTSVGLGVAATSAIGAAIAQFIGFSYTFALVGVMAIIGFFILLRLEKKNHKIKKKSQREYFKRPINKPGKKIIK